MNLTDPFGRLAQQQKLDYASLRQSLMESGITSRAKAEALLVNIRQRALRIAAIVVAIAGALVFFLPEQKFAIIVIGALPVLWLFSTNLKGRRLIRQYIEEEFGGEQ